MKFNSLLHDYIEERGGLSRKYMDRQEQDSSPEISCANNFPPGSCTADKDRYLTIMFETYKFRVNAIENNENKITRLGNYLKWFGKKSNKSEDFTETASWLQSVAGEMIILINKHSYST